MNAMNPLSELRVGETALVTGLLTLGAIRRRLLDIGLIEGTKIQCLLKSPGGDPIAYQIRGAVIALRKEDANEVMVSSIALAE